MRTLMLLLLCSAAMLRPASTLAYEIGTHAYCSKVAVDGSVLSPTHVKSIVPVLGFERLDAIKPFEALVPPLTNPVRGYFDNAPRPAISIASEDASNLSLRRIQAEEGNIFERLAAVGLVPGEDDPTQFDQRVVAWVMRGAVREDDNAIGPFEIGDRDGDPWNTVFRAGRHFYDPINRRGLDEDFTCGLFGCRPAIDWAAGRTDVLNGPGTLDIGRENHFSWQDARDNYWWALTYNLNPENSSLGHGIFQQAESGYRQLRFATTLKAVGQVIHLVQDMAQPQHARNDSHGPAVTTLATGDSPTDGAFEAYTEARLFRDAVPSEFTNAIRRFDGSLVQRADIPMLRLGLTYPVPRFSQVVEYFTTQGTDGAVGARRGMADLANRGFFTASTLPMNVAANKPDDFVGTFLDPPRPFTNTPGFYQEGQIALPLFFNGALVLKQNLLFATVPDVLAPNWNAQSGLFAADGRMPLLTRSQMFRAADLIATPTPITEDSRFVLSNEVFTAQADALLPRAVAYSTGLIDYFFRGRLEVTPTAQKAFALLNQGEPHTMDLEGYPRRPDGRIFGFEKVRLALRNVSEAIVESGPVAPALPQSSPSGVLVAVARFHRNTCYQPDLSGERQSAFAPPPSTGTVTEPTCPPGTTPRTDFQEIATSAPLTVAGVADLPGGEGVSGPALPVEKVFDFSADPIPVNATDLFIQVVYRGALGEEPDGIAVGGYDVREPAFVGIWNNTDFYWNEGLGQWLSQGGLFPWQNAVFLDVCTGVPSRFAWSGGPIAGAPILGVPVPDPGVVRLALLFAIPNSPTQQFSVRVTPNMIDATSAPQRSWFTRGAIHQANLEAIPEDLLDTPQTCPDNPTAGAAVWCKSPIQRRRGQPFGHVLAPVFYDTTNANITAPDVDATPLPPFPGLRVATTGTVRYNDDVLSPCPLPPPPPNQTPEAAALIELLETAADLGLPID